MFMKKILFPIAFLSYLLVSPVKAQVASISAAHEQRAKEIVAKMTLEEKLQYIGGHDVFSIRAIPRLGLPEIKMADGPQGIRNDTQSTMYPCGILSASTWNRLLVHKLGKGLGQDAKSRGISFLLGPGVNMYRAPMCGRNFEYFGEDPFLTSEVAKEYVLGVQSEGVIATIKHFAANNQEWNRYDVSSDVDERTLFEIYFPAFRKAVQEAGVGAVMNSYNLLNGVHATENYWLNVDVLRNQWGFKGVLMSDWVSVHSGVAAANGGLDLEMPNGEYMNEKNLMSAIQNGLVAEKTIDRKVQHILQTLIAFGMLDRSPQDDSIAKDNPFSRQTALELAREGIVLLKNEDDLLPLKGTTGLLGPNADRIPTGGGSGFVSPYSTVSVWQGMKELCGKKAHLISDDLWIKDELSCFYPADSSVKQGFAVEYFNNKDFTGAPAFVGSEQQIHHEWRENAPIAGIQPDHFSVRWTSVYKPQATGTLKIHVEGDDGYRVFVDNQEVLSDWGDHPLTAKDALLNVEAGKQYHIRVEYYDNIRDATIKASFSMLNEESLKEQLRKVKNLVLCVGFDSSTEAEGFDRTFSLPGWQNALIQKITTMHDRVTVVVNSGGGVNLTPWIDQAKAVLMVWYPGQEGGKAIAEILTGQISPSGKLPISIESKWEDNPVYHSYYDHRAVPHRRVQYTEGIFVGYRGYDRLGIQPLFPFGYGLSYTTFSYANLHVEKLENKTVRLSFDVKNTGKVGASEVAQVYVRDVESSVIRPSKELKGYEKVYLKKGETKRLSIELNEDAFSFYDVESHQFQLEAGDFEILVGSSSQHLPLKKLIRM